MNVRVEHKGSNITDHVIRYDRESKICTGIGLLELEVDYTYSTGFNPWDVIEIYEGNNLAGTYYVSSESNAQPSASRTINAQDASKRLSDYFIPDSYLIDYPSYSRYWVDLFLTEAGVSHTFLTDEPGQLLSNNTSLGLTSAYENVMQLLQMSGWYITFDPSGNARIGKANVDGGHYTDSYGVHDILEIKVDKHDRMYRNRVVVWGNGDPATNRWVFADVTKHTKWDYDLKDKRTVLISNSNIPSVKDAFVLANMAITEFAKLSVEKHLTVTGYRAIGIGEVVRLNTKIFSGKGVITTLGSSMSRTGLVTNITLDERCPRLFGFYSLGGFVYVGTFGSGVWRRHIQPSGWVASGVSGIVQSGFASGIFDFSGWHDYSSGLKDMNVTDLHVNAGLLACVTSSGQIYYSYEENATSSGSPDYAVWSGIVLSGLDVTYSGAVVDSKTYSGIIGRACIIDRDYNLLRYAVDTRSGINYGDYLMETDPLKDIYNPLFWYTNPSGNIIGLTINSGLITSGMPQNRSWILDVNPYSGGMDAYPIFVASGIPTPSGFPDVLHTTSGTYNFAVYDIENDGTHDYVEAKTYVSGWMADGLPTSYYNPNRLYAVNSVNSQLSFNYGGDVKKTMPTSIPYSGYPDPVLQTPYYFSSTDSIYHFDGGFALYEDSPTIGIVQMSFSSGFSATDNRRLVIYKFDYERDLPFPYRYTYLTSYGYDKTVPLACTRPNLNVFRFYFRYTTDFRVGKHLIIIDYDIKENVWSERIIYDCLQDNSDSIEAKLSCVTLGTTLYTVKCRQNEDNYSFFLDTYKTDLDTGVEEYKRVLTTTKIGSYPDVGAISYINPTALVGINGTEPYIHCTYSYTRVDDVDSLYTKVMKYSQDGFYSGGVEEVSYDFSAARGNYPFQGNNRVEVDGENLIQLNQYSPSFNYSIYGVRDGIVIVIDSVVDFMYGTKVNSGFTGGYYFGVDESHTLVGSRITGFDIYDNFGNKEEDIPNPSGYELYSYAGRDYFNKEMIFVARNTILSSYEFVTLGSTGYNVTRRQNWGGSSNPTMVVGNFHISSKNLGATTNSISWYRPIIPGYYPMYLLLQRDGWDFNVVKSGIYRDRLDISNYSPMVTMDRRVSSAETYFISQDNSVLKTTYVGISGYKLDGVSSSGSIFTLGVLSEDFRYTDFDNTSESGTSRNILVLYSGGVGSLDAYGSGGLVGIEDNFSGYATRLETTNYALPGQYIFVAVSGMNTNSGWGFYQKNPATLSGVLPLDTFSGSFVDYSSGYPQARTTIIRIDDQL
jgi:hypothetical protein